MGLFDFLKPKGEAKSPTAAKNMSQKKEIRNSPDCFADSSSIDPSERSYYQPDNYYTYYSYPGSAMSTRVVTFEERKASSFPSSNGLYVGEIMLLEYCTKGNYPKPKSGYPGFWWFKYGIRDVGHALESLEQRGYIKWAPKYHSLSGLKVAELKTILTNAGQPTAGKKAELIDRIGTVIPEAELEIPGYLPRYQLTELGAAELKANGYIPYMHNHRHGTIEDTTFEREFTVWSVNRLFNGGDTTNWRVIVGEMERERFGVDMANGSQDPKETLTAEEMRAYLSNNREFITNQAKTPGDGFKEESMGLDYKLIGKDKEALLWFSISIEKGFWAPALYDEMGVLLRRYDMREEELAIVESELKNAECKGSRAEEVAKRKAEILSELGRA